ncbi:hypothetical protein BST97_09905 [Nonlabens spongiae]|uniref:Uncharacterized protein n=1 Tax=Nonlabens spongiae TaxID=331648 RepID=A0A1W6MKY9_9FLAO|nr:hypothetical protein [Nonlabens spongiae]ARN78278.1 hypothetical protein BST97_09905 [Nonlabens spongiae]
MTDERIDFNSYKVEVIKMLRLVKAKEKNIKRLLMIKDKVSFDHLLLNSIRKKKLDRLRSKGLIIQVLDSKSKGKIKSKNRYSKEFYDETQNSVMPIYTPMGNKR